MQIALARSLDDKVEIRFEVQANIISTLDAFCQSTGKSRTDVMKELIEEWSQKKEREAIMICRARRINPLSSEADRKTED